MKEFTFRLDGKEVLSGQKCSIHRPTLDTSERKRKGAGDTPECSRKLGDKSRPGIAATNTREASALATKLLGRVVTSKESLSEAAFRHQRWRQTGIRAPSRACESLPDAPTPMTTGNGRAVEASRHSNGARATGGVPTFGTNGHESRSA